MVAGVDERQRDVLDNREGRDKIEVLENETDFFGAETSLFAGGDARDIFASKNILAGASLVEKTDNV